MTLVGADGEVNVKELLRVLSPVFAALLTENNVTGLKMIPKLLILSC